MPKSRWARAHFSASTAVAFFRRFPPQNATAWVRFAQALNGTGFRDEAKSAARNGWVMGLLSNADEAFVLDDLPRRADHRSITTRGWTSCCGRGRRPRPRARSC